MTDDKFSPVQMTNNHYQLQINTQIAREAYKEYDALGHGNQSFERLCERGGFGIGEILTLLYGRIKRLEGLPTDQTYGSGMKVFHQPPDKVTE